MNELKGQLGLDEWLELIKEDKNLNGAYISIAQYIDLIEKENQKLKAQISVREKQNRELKETNKILSLELTKDNLIKQDHLTTCCGIPIGDIPKLIEKNKKLEDKLTETENWLRPAILQLMDFAKQDYYWITDQQIDSAKLVPIGFAVMGDRCVKFEKLERGVSDE